MNAWKLILNKHIHTPTPTHPNTRAITHSPIHAQSHTHTHTPIHAQSHTHIHTHIHAHTHTHTCTHRRTRIQISWHCHTYTRSLQLRYSHKLWVPHSGIWWRVGQGARACVGGWVGGWVCVCVCVYMFVHIYGCHCTEAGSISCQGILRCAASGNKRFCSKV